MVNSYGKEPFRPNQHCLTSSGPTGAEVIIWVDVNLESDPRCVGYVVAGMEVLTLDGSLRRVPIGVQGTIYTSGSHLTLGCLYQLSLTDQVIIANPDSLGKLMYNTGWSGHVSTFWPKINPS